MEKLRLREVTVTQLEAAELEFKPGADGLTFALLPHRLYVKMD